MPHKFNATRRHRFAKKQYRVTNWPEYNESLRQRGDLTIWNTDDALGQWTAPRRSTRGGQPKHSDLAIATCLTLGVVSEICPWTVPSTKWRRVCCPVRMIGNGEVRVLAPEIVRVSIVRAKSGTVEAARTGHRACADPPRQACPTEIFRNVREIVG